MDYIWIVAAVIVPVIVIVLTILYFKCKEDPYNTYMYMYIPESASHRVTTDIDPNRDYTDYEAITLFHEMEDVTLLRTNKGRVHINSLARHAEIVFIKDTPNPEDVTGLWITNSPCYNCAQHLIKHFKSCCKKPDIFIGKIYQQEKEKMKKNDEGLQDLMKERFEIQVWESFQQDPQIVHVTRNHLLGLSQKM